MKIYFVLSFKQKQVKKYKYFATYIFSSEKCDFFGKKNWKRWSNNIETFHKEKPGAIKNLKYFLSETIHAQENGRRGTHFENNS